MKVFLKTIFVPVIALMWLMIKIGAFITYISGLILGIASGLLCIISLIFLFTGSVKNCLIGLAIAFLLSPYGIPMLTIRTLGAIQKLRLKLQGIIYD